MMLIKMADPNASDKLIIHAQNDHAVLELSLVAVVTDDDEEYGVFSSGQNHTSDIYIFGIKRANNAITSLFNLEDDSLRQQIYTEFLHISDV